MNRVNRAILEDQLVAAERHLAEVERHLAYLRKLVAQREREGHDAAQATRLLAQVLAMRIADRDRVRTALGL